MASKLKTYHLIADILSFEVATETIIKQWTLHRPDWDAMVVEGSRHLVLPAIYCRLKAKQLLDQLPEDLQQYLEDLTTINRNRNKSILKQAKDISILFESHDIDHVFLKGTAMLASGYYEDIAERMVGDIDILIAKAQLNTAYKLLQDHDYKPIAESTFGSTYFGHKHLPRLASDTHMSAVELHEKLFMTFKTDLLLNKDILVSKIDVGSIAIPDSKHLEHHNVFNFQINDYGYYYNTINFRTFYDTLILKQQSQSSAIAADTHRALYDYRLKLNLFFNGIIDNPKLKFSLRLWYFKLKLKFSLLNQFSTQVSYILKTAGILAHRLYYFMFNRSYRKDVLKDRKRVIKSLKSKF